VSLVRPLGHPLRWLASRRLRQLEAVWRNRRLRSRHQLGDKHKVPRASNQREVIDAVLAATPTPPTARPAAG
jgi:hypothetical protein